MFGIGVKLISIIFHKVYSSSGSAENLDNLFMARSAAST